MIEQKLHLYMNELIALAQKGLRGSKNNVMYDYWTGYKQAILNLEKKYFELVNEETQRICDEAIKNLKERNEN